MSVWLSGAPVWADIALKGLIGKHIYKIMSNQCFSFFFNQPTDQSHPIDPGKNIIHIIQWLRLVTFERYVACFVFCISVKDLPLLTMFLSFLQLLLAQKQFMVMLHAHVHWNARRRPSAALPRPAWLFHQSPPCTPSYRKMYNKMYMCYTMVYKIGILGNLPIAHDSLWVLEVMFIEEKKSNLRKFCTVWSLIWAPSQNPLRCSESICTDKNLLKFNNFFYKHDLITPKISLCYRQMVCSAYFIFHLFVFQ
jgi:hypothetical protein